MENRREEMEEYCMERMLNVIGENVNNIKSRAIENSVITKEI